MSKIVSALASQSGFYKMFRLRAGNQHIRRHPELAAVKLLASGDVLRGLALDPLMQIAPVVDPPDLDQFVVAVRVEPRAVMARGPHQQDFRGQARLANIGFFEKLLALQKRRADGHVGCQPCRLDLSACSAPCSLSFSAWKCVVSASTNGSSLPSIT